MPRIIDYPFFGFLWSLVLLCSSTLLGLFLRKRYGAIADDAREDLSIVRSAALTLLALIIGFMFSMAVSRYDQRKIYEEEESNAIGTEYVRVELLPSGFAVRVQPLLRDYLDNRILFYQTRNSDRVRQIDARTAQLQTELWSAIQGLTAVQQTPVVGLAVSGMNDVLNSQSYTQAAWSNRIPRTAWVLLGIIAMFCSLMLGFGARGSMSEARMHFVLPFLLAVALSLIADIETPRGGLIQIAPENLIALKASLGGH